VRNVWTYIPTLPAIFNILVEIKSLVGFSIAVVVPLVTFLDTVISRYARVFTTIHGISIQIKETISTISHTALPMNTGGVRIRKRAGGAFIRVPAMVTLTNKLNAKIFITVVILLALEDTQFFITDFRKGTVSIVVALFFDQTTSCDNRYK
jgi:hypothetical protein